MVHGERWMPYDGHPIELEDGRRVPLETLLVEARRLRAVELRSLWSGVPARGARFARSRGLYGRAQHRTRTVSGAAVDARLSGLLNKSLASADEARIVIVQYGVAAWKSNFV